jgi:putative membrane protein
MWHQMWGWDGSGGWGWFGLMHLLWWVVVIAGGIAVFRWGVGSRPRGQPGAGRPLEILGERFARGEIDQAEYEERKRLLNS